MFKFWVVLLISFSMYEGVPSKLTTERICENALSDCKTLRLSMYSERNQDNDWVDTFTAWAEYSNSSDRMNVDLNHTIFRCDGKRIIFIGGVTDGAVSTTAPTKDRIHFHVRCGKNAAILDHGRAAQKLNNDDHANSQVFTNRPLRNNEIFEVKLDKKNTKYQYSLGIGIITRTPDSVDIIPEMWKSPVTWIMHHNTIHNNAAGILGNYGKDINKLQEGERVGVMRTEFGTLHFFINGVDQGPAASNIPSPVYGIVELWYNAIKVSIVD